MIINVKKHYGDVVIRICGINKMIKLENVLNNNIVII